MPRAYLAWNRRHPHRHVVDPQTNLVIEGYASAANTFAREALQRANPGIRLASHLHTVVHVREALRLGIPVLVLLRPPIDSVVSVLARFPERHDVADELAEYERFYRGVLGVADRVVLARFEDTTQRLGDVVRLLNWQLGTELEPFRDDDADAMAVVNATIGAWTEVVFGPNSERHRASPTAARQRVAGPIRARLEEPSFEAVRRRCESLHRALSAIAAARFDAWQLETTG